jgi:hypothetical protein
MTVKTLISRVGAAMLSLALPAAANAVVCDWTTSMTSTTFTFHLPSTSSSVGPGGVQLSIYNPTGNADIKYTLLDDTQIAANNCSAGTMFSNCTGNFMTKPSSATPCTLMSCTTGYNETLRVKAGETSEDTIYAGTDHKRIVLVVSLYSTGTLAKAPQVEAIFLNGSGSTWEAIDFQQLQRDECR